MVAIRLCETFVDGKAMHSMPLARGYRELRCSLFNLFPFCLSGILYVNQSEVFQENHFEDSNCVLHQSEPLICASQA